ncbi:unnamed protein product [Lepeophtheirus salmonis]|uniref:(salmon louse) hypothetical protein n=1 Tax=Lepeophtheirus salmonis TaxID=72036 RepID=A0A7R8CAQ4_LEPSM|nr:unnamed protein product [Lepeophtheirus salmonis]CAF2749233.1 unnamed protein product [Lepeophtheirus salmonis]
MFSETKKFEGGIESLGGFSQSIYLYNKQCSWCSAVTCASESIIGIKRRGRVVLFYISRTECDKHIQGIMDTLKENVMINQFVLVAGCSRDQATKILSQAGWQFQTALSMYFQEAAIPKNNAGLALLTPTNTPATPPNFPEALNMFSNMSTSDSSSKWWQHLLGHMQILHCHLEDEVIYFKPLDGWPPPWGVSNGSTSSFPSSNSNTADCQFQIDNNYIGSSNSVNNPEAGVFNLVKEGVEFFKANG